nr:PREDICTED: rho-related GTP-binding protein RhoF isoform X1 [Paralichthys olivaceus]
MALIKGERASPVKGSNPLARQTESSFEKNFFFFNQWHLRLPANMHLQASSRVGNMQTIPPLSLKTGLQSSITSCMSTFLTELHRVKKEKKLNKERLFFFLEVMDFELFHLILPSWYVYTRQEDYDRLRPLSYQEADLILVCFDVTNPTSFENVLIKWFPEVRHFCQDTPVILIGCKTDLRKDKECARKLRAMNLAPITYTQGEEIQQQMKAELYLECSAKYQEHVEDIFREAAKKALAHCRKQKKCKRMKKCVVL